jgi:hypothetical protein
MIAGRQGTTVLCFACGGQVEAGRATCPLCGHSMSAESIVQGHWSPPCPRAAAAPPSAPVRLAEIPVGPAMPCLPVLQPVNDDSPACGPLGAAPAAGACAVAPPALLARQACRGLTARRLDRPAVLCLGAGLAMAAIAAAVPAMKFIFSYLTIIIHELGHAIFGWLFGYASVPAFDFHYGGGLTVQRAQSPAVLVFLYVLAAILAFRCRRNRLALCLLGGLLALHGVLAWTSAHMPVVLFMGHGTELVLAGVFLYRSASGSGILRRVERPLYAFCGWFIVICDALFAWGLATQHGERILYEAAKGGGHWMDFSRIAEQYLHVGLPAVASFFGLACLSVPAVALLACRYQNRLHAAWRRLCARDLSGRSGG